jgi:hypothetical protein
VKSWVEIDIFAWLAEVLIRFWIKKELEWQKNKAGRPRKFKPSKSRQRASLEGKTMVVGGKPKMRLYSPRA